MMNRRQAVERISLILGGSLSPQLTAGVMGQVLNTGASVTVGAAQQALLAEVADVIIPETDTPGAKEAGAEAFIVRVMRDCYELEAQESFYAGMAKIDAASQEAHQENFVDLSADQKVAVLEKIAGAEAGFFRQLKQLVVTGYFTSEIGATQALEYLPIPGKFEGDVPLKPGQKGWAIPR